MTGLRLWLRLCIIVVVQEPQWGRPFMKSLSWSGRLRIVLDAFVLVVILVAAGYAFSTEALVSPKKSTENEAVVSHEGGADRSTETGS